MERNEARLDSKPRDREIFVWGNKLVTFTTYGAETIIRERTRRKTNGNS